MITGITGSIGTAFVELLRNQHDITGIDRNEHNVANFKKSYPEIDVKAGDFKNINFKYGRFELLIHLAAMKHIDLCEMNVNECIENNIIKTYELFKNAHHNNVDILFMSTDKAVEPCSVYGYSKALGEHIATQYGGVVVRSGNVVASNGSVFGIWQKSIEEREPIKITHRDMERYFISPENLVIQVWINYLEGKKLIIPKMDRKIKLIKLAEEILQKNGFTLENYKPGIEYTGLRLGEKLSERLKWGYE